MCPTNFPVFFLYNTIYSRIIGTSHHFFSIIIGPSHILFQYYCSSPPLIPVLLLLYSTNYSNIIKTSLYLIQYYNCSIPPLILILLIFPTPYYGSVLPLILSVPPLIPVILFICPLKLQFTPRF